MRRLGLHPTFFSYLHNISGADLRWRTAFNTDNTMVFTDLHTIPACIFRNLWRFVKLICGNLCSHLLQKVAKVGLKCLQKVAKVEWKTLQKVAEIGRKCLQKVAK